MLEKDIQEVLFSEEQLKTRVNEIAQEIEREGCIQLSIADDTLIPLVTVSTGHIDGYLLQRTGADYQGPV